VQSGRPRNLENLSTKSPLPRVDTDQHLRRISNVTCYNTAGIYLENIVCDFSCSKEQKCLDMAYCKEHFAKSGKYPPPRTFMQSNLTFVPTPPHYSLLYSNVLGPRWRNLPVKMITISGHMTGGCIRSSKTFPTVFAFGRLPRFRGK
jgi:hypothetical protein